MTHGRKTGGRQKGTPNKRTQATLELVEERYPGFNAVEQMVKLAIDEIAEIETRDGVDIAELQRAWEETAHGEDKHAWAKAIKGLLRSKEFALDALKAAAPYMHSRLKETTIKMDEAPDVAGVLMIPLDAKGAESWSGQVKKIGGSGDAGE